MLQRPVNAGKLVPREVIENIFLKKIMQQCPEATVFAKQIKFNHSGSSARLDLALLPENLAKKISDLFE